jgi:copper(I)-binding protein
VSRLPLFAGFLLILAPAGLAQESDGDGRVLATWARATTGPTAAVYLELHNEGSEADWLIGVSASIAERAEIHELRTTNGVISMSAIPDVPLPAGANVRLAPGELHPMLFGVDQPLNPEDRFSLTPTFERSGAMTVEVVTGGAGAVVPPIFIEL